MCFKLLLFFLFVDVCSTLLGCHSNPEASVCDPLRGVSCFSLLVLKLEPVIRSKSFIVGHKRFAYCGLCFLGVMCDFMVSLSLEILFLVCEFICKVLSDLALEQ